MKDRGKSFVVESEGLQIQGKELHCVVHIKNMGRTSGKEVMRIYVRRLGDIEDDAEKELMGSEESKELEPFEDQEIEFVVSIADLAPGKYQVFIDNSKNTIYSGDFLVTSVIGK